MLSGRLTWKPLALWARMYPKWRVAKGTLLQAYLRGGTHSNETSQTVILIVKKGGSIDYKQGYQPHHGNRCRKLLLDTECLATEEVQALIEKYPQFVKSACDSCKLQRLVFLTERGIPIAPPKEPWERLEGSAAQIKWAKDIRQRFLARNPNCDKSQLSNSAKWWIDNHR